MSTEDPPQPIDEYRLKNETRFLAIEYVIGYLARLTYRDSVWSRDEILSAHAGLREMAKGQTFPETDPVESDMVADEFAIALDDLLRVIESGVLDRGTD